MSCCSRNRKEIFFGSTLQASKLLLTNRIDGLKGNNTIFIGGCSTKVQINGDLIVTGKNCTNCITTSNGDEVSIQGDAPIVGEVLVATSPTTAEWAVVAGAGDVMGPVSSTDDEIVRYNGATGTMLKSSGTPTLINDAGGFAGPSINTNDGNGITTLGFNTPSTGSSNTFLGQDAGKDNTVGTENVFVGFNAAESNTTGTANVTIGVNAGRLNQTGTQNTMIGFKAGENTTGSNNTLIGNQAGETMTTETDCVIIGYQAGQNNTLSNRLIIENSNDNLTPLIDGNFATDQLTINGDLTVTGANGADRLRTTGADVIIGTSAPPSANQALIATNATTATWQDVGDVDGAGISVNNELVRFNGASGKVIQGTPGNSTILNNFGEFNGPSILTDNGAQNAIFGSGTGKNGQNNTIIGNNAGSAVNFASSDNTLIGKEAGTSMVSATGNTFVGSSAGRFNSTGEENVFLGAISGFNNTSGINNTFVGTGSGTGNTTGNDNVYIGHSSATLNTSGIDNVFIGTNSGYDGDGYSGNVMIGKNAGQLSVGNNNVFIGFEAGQNNTDSDRLIIENSSDNLTPLIDGNFASNQLTINGNLTVTGANGADRLRTTGADVVIGTSAPPSVNQALVATNATTATWQDIVQGGNTSADNELVRFNGTTGKIIQNNPSPIIVSDSGSIIGDYIETGDFISSTRFGIDTSNQGSGNSLFGYRAGFNLNGGSGRNVFVGYEAGRNFTDDADNSCFGYQAGANITTVNGLNTLIGKAAGSSGANQVYERCTIIGADAGRENQVDGCVLIGYDAGSGNTVANRLIIENTNDIATPLVDGNFAADTIRFNGTVTLGDDTETQIHVLNGLTQTGVGAAGGASALPATPLGYLKVNIRIATVQTDVLIPFYQV